MTRYRNQDLEASGFWEKGGLSLCLNPAAVLVQTLDRCGSAERVILHIEHSRIYVFRSLEMLLKYNYFKFGFAYG